MSPNMAPYDRATCIIGPAEPAFDYAVIEHGLFACLEIIHEL